MPRFARERSAIFSDDYDVDRAGPDLFRVGDPGRIPPPPLLQAIQHATNSEDNYIAAYAYRALGKTQLAQGEEDAAEKMINQAIQLFEAMGIKEEAKTTKALLKETV